MLPMVSNMRLRVALELSVIFRLAGVKIPYIQVPTILCRSKDDFPSFSPAARVLPYASHFVKRLYQLFCDSDEPR